MLVAEGVISTFFGDISLPINDFCLNDYYFCVNIYIPLLNDAKVELADENEVAEALGLNNVKNPVTCGYLEMYNGSDKVSLPVKMDSRFLIGPEGAHLNISGISGLAAKTSYSMFLLKAIQDKCYEPDSNDDVAFVLFNVKGKDLLAINQLAEFDDEKKKEAVFAVNAPKQGVVFSSPMCVNLSENKFSGGTHERKKNNHMGRADPCLPE